jgi:hypothetical protein
MTWRRAYCLYCHSFNTDWSLKVWGVFVPGKAVCLNDPIPHTDTQVCKLSCSIPSLSRPCCERKKQREKLFLIFDWWRVIERIAMTFSKIWATSHAVVDSRLPRDVPCIAGFSSLGSGIPLKTIVLVSRNSLTFKEENERLLSCIEWRIF